MDQRKDFTLSVYEKLISRISKEYRCIPFNSSFEQLQGKLILLRHDIDYSIRNALKIAAIENKYDVSSTFFINIHSEFYNFFEKETLNILQQIIQMGHSIGIHLDAEFWNIQNEFELIDCLAKEKQLLETSIGVSVDSFSFHNPTTEVLTFKKDQYTGLFNAYSKRFSDHFKYCSDSNGYWRFENMHELVFSGDYERLQLLTHPVWWSQDLIFPREKIYNELFSDAKLKFKAYDEHLLNFDRKNLNGSTDTLLYLKSFLSDLYYHLDRLWNDQNYFQLYTELKQIIKKQLFGIILGFAHKDPSIAIHFRGQKVSFNYPNEDFHELASSCEQYFRSFPQPPQIIKAGIELSELNLDMIKESTSQLMHYSRELFDFNTQYLNSIN